MGARLCGILLLLRGVFLDIVKVLQTSPQHVRDVVVETRAIRVWLLECGFELCEYHFEARQITADAGCFRAPDPLEAKFIWLNRCGLPGEQERQDHEGCRDQGL